MRYTKKPVTVEAFRWLGKPSFPDGFEELHKLALITADEKLAIQTLEGVITATDGDWIIKGIKGEFYPCKPDIFEATYQPAPPPDAREVDEDEKEWVKKILEVYGRAQSRHTGYSFIPVFIDDALYEAAKTLAARDEAVRRDCAERAIAWVNSQMPRALSDAGEDTLRRSIMGKEGA